MKILFIPHFCLCFFLLYGVNALAYDCDDPIIDIQEEIEFEFTGELSTEITPEFLGLSIDYPCGTHEVALWVAKSDIEGFKYNDVILSKDLVGSTIKIKVILEFAHHDPIVKNVTLQLTGINCDDYGIDIPESYELVFDGEPYIILEPEMINLNIDLPCDEAYTIKLERGKSTSSQYNYDMIGTTQICHITIYVQDESIFESQFEVHVSGVKPDPIQMFIEDVDFNAGQEIQIDIWAQDLTFLAAWAFEFKFAHAEIIEILPSTTFNETPHNIFTSEASESVIRTLWLTADGYPITTEANETWFTLKLIPSIPGSLSDIFIPSLSNDFNVIAFDDADNTFVYPTDFITFQIESKTTTSTDQQFNHQNIELYPNPSSDFICIEGHSIEHDEFIEIINSNGEVVRVAHRAQASTEMQIQVSDLSPGIYRVRSRDRRTVYSIPFIKI